MDSPYEVLRIDPDADEDEVEEAFRRRVIETHPDQGGDLEEFRAVMAAHEAITSGKAATRDRQGPQSGWGAAGPPPRPGAGHPRDDGTGTVHDDGQRTVRDEAGSTRRDDGRPETAHVQYLNYEVLDDHGWSLDDEDLFEKAAAAGLDSTDYGRISMGSDGSLLEAAEDCGFAWPYSCRGGACANCAVAVTEGEMAMSIDNILTDDLVDRGIRLSCIGEPMTGELSVVFNVKHLPDVEELLLPPGPFAEAQGDD